MTDEEKAGELLGRLVEDDYLRGRLVRVIVEGIRYGRSEAEKVSRQKTMDAVKRAVTDALNGADPAHAHAYGPEHNMMRAYAEAAAVAAVGALLLLQGGEP